MNDREKIIKSPEYWLEEIQGEVYRLLREFMDNNNLSQKDVASRLGVSPSYVSQVLNGNFNFTISKLVELSIAVGKVPDLRFISIKDFLSREELSLPGYSFEFSSNADGGTYVNIKEPVHIKPVENSEVNYLY